MLSPHTTPSLADIVTGGTVHGPQPRDYTIKLPKKVRSLGLRVALSIKYAQGDLHIVDSFDIASRKTKDFKAIVDAHGWSSALLLLPQPLPNNLLWASGNLSNIQTLSYRSGCHSRLPVSPVTILATASEVGRGTLM